ncbi:MAG: hypothetical protein OEN52_03860 [Gammaproteobacteria bacterium]|nr:hypothetical protein [Gammaproteobacteria bacterium]MDH3560075.1 hypothetical protein [Gammaproteobacteria bacterium]
MNHCPHCGTSRRPRLEPAWLLWLALLIWLVPLGFLSMGFWPFLLLPSIAISAWAFLAVRPVCPQCGKRRKDSASADV